MLFFIGYPYEILIGAIIYFTVNAYKQKQALSTKCVALLAIESLFWWIFLPFAAINYLESYPLKQQKNS